MNIILIQKSISMYFSRQRDILICRGIQWPQENGYRSRGTRKTRWHEEIKFFAFDDWSDLYKWKKMGFFLFDNFGDFYEWYDIITLFNLKYLFLLWKNQVRYEESFLKTLNYFNISNQIIVFLNIIFFNEIK